MSKLTDPEVPVEKVTVKAGNYLSAAIYIMKKYAAISASAFTGYWGRSFTDRIQRINAGIGEPDSKTKKLVTGAMLSVIAAILQSAGALGGPGFAVSALVTLPIALASTLALYTGAMAYAVTLCLLLILQPSELIVFPFTTGLLGLGIGLGVKLFKKRVVVIAFSGLSLTCGIVFLLYVLSFPVLGPLVSGKFQIVIPAAIYGFSFLYSWLWVEVTMAILKFIGKALVKL